MGTRLANVTGDGDVLSALGLNIRSYNALVNSGISTVRDLLAKTQVEIATLPGIGPSVLIHLEWH